MRKDASMEPAPAEPDNQAAANLTALIESTEDLIWSIDLNFGLLTFNRALQRHVERHWGTQAAIGKRPKDLLPAERAAIWPPLFQRALTQGPFRTEIPFPNNRIVEMSFNPIVVDGKATGLSIFGKDVTERNRNEKELRETAEFLKESQRIGALGSYVFDFTTGVFTSSDTLNELFGIHKETDIAASWNDLVHPQDRAMVLQYFVTEVMEKRQPFNKEYRIVRASDDAVRWLHGMGRMEFDVHGKPTRMCGIIKDITERMQVELQLRASEQRYRATFEQPAIGIAHISFDGAFLHCNARFAEIVGYSPEEVLGLNTIDITDPIYVPECVPLLEQCAHGTVERASLEKRYIRKDGTPTWVKISLSAERDSQGKPIHLISFVEDINPRKAAEQSLTAAQEALRHSEERYRTAFQTSIDAININRMSDGVYIDVNNAFLDIVAFSRDEVIGRSSIDLAIWADCADRQRMVDQVSRTSICRDLEARFRKKNGEVFWGLMSASLIEIEGVPCVLTITRDISAAKAAEQLLTQAAEALRVSEERYRTVFQTSLDPILINRTSDRRFIDVNQAFLDVMGFKRDEVIGRTSLELNLWADPRDLENVDEILKQTLQCRNVEIQFRKKDGETLWGLMSSSVMEIDGVQCVLTVTRDISSAKAAEDEIRSLAFYDPLTGLPNRRLLMERLHVTLASSSRTGRLRALLFVDLDNFKTLNDTLGHQTGDLLLQEAAKRLTACVREADTVGRLGGDEFVLMLEDLSDLPEDAAAQAKAVGEKILSVVTQPYQLNGRECRSSASIGISVFGGRRENSNEILQQADIAMYQAKAAGRNTMRFFAPALQAAVNARAALEEDLRESIKTCQFVLYYQPQIDRNRLIGAEALIRWRHPTRGILPPGEFIPLAEETGLILPLGKWVLDAACAQIAAWADNKQTARLAVSINISARQFHQPEFVEQVLAALDGTRADPAKLRLELTESILVENVQDVSDKMKELKSHGLRFSLDDFGTGYSSLAYLKKLPLDQVKIDRSFVRDILTEESSAAIAQTIISLSRAMGLPVIAEGVETEEQRDCLARMGCHAFQGFLFGRPLPLEEFEGQWLASAGRSVSISS
jgi:diguanylate cyclase (GGDEF)-like protein/PAS domain S-box-containing protein